MINLFHKVWIGRKERFSCFSTLTKTLALISEPSARLVNNLKVNSHIKNGAFFRDALTIHNVKLSNLKRWSNLVLYNLNANTVTNVFSINLNAVNAANIHADSREELKSPTTGSGLWATKHNANLLSKLVNEDTERIRLRKRTR